MRSVSYESLRRIQSTGAVLCLLCSVGPVHAQATLSREPSTSEEAQGLDEVVVTAQRREQRLQEVPVAVIALSNAQLEQANVTRLDDLQRVAPGFVVQPSPFGQGALTVTMRSQRQALPNPTYDPSVAVYFADVLQGRSQGLNGSLYDLSSVQVLKGPQGTLFGRNTTGGAVLLTPQAPSGQFGGYLKLGAGDYDQFQAEGAVDLPGNDILQVRLSGRHSEHSGYNRVLNTGRHVNDEQVNAVRASFRFTPMADFTNALVADYIEENDAGTGYKLLTVTPGGTVDQAYGLGAELAALRDRDFFTTSSNVPLNGNRIEALTVANTTTYEAGDITLKNIFGYRWLRSLISFDLDGSSKDALYAGERVSMNQYSEEPQILGKAFGDTVDYILGAYLFEESGHDRQLTPTLGTVSDVDLDVTNKSHAIFGQLSWTLPWVEGVSLTGGVRQTWDKRELRTRSKRGGVCRLRVDAAGNLSDTGTIVQDPCNTSVDADFDALTYSLSAAWKIDPNLMVYLAHRRGYRSGGFSNSITKASELTPYKPEFITDYELGFKADYSVGPVTGRTNLALYTGDYTDIQRNLTTPVTQNGQTFVRSQILNAASARVRGVEIDQTIIPWDPLEIRLSYAYSDAQYRSFIAPNGSNYTKSPFGGAPEHTLTGSARLQLPVPERVGDLFAEISGSYRSESVFADVTSFNPVTQTVIPSNVIHSYHTYDARVDWEDVNGMPITVSAYVRNFTNEKYFIGGQDFASLGFSSGILGTPRTVGAGIRYAF